MRSTYVLQEFTQNLGSIWTTVHNFENTCIFNLIVRENWQEYLILYQKEDDASVCSSKFH